jgi:hypothetical protein
MVAHMMVGPETLEEAVMFKARVRVVLAGVFVAGLAGLACGNGNHPSSNGGGGAGTATTGTGGSSADSTGGAGGAVTGASGGAPGGTGSGGGAGSGGAPASASCDKVPTPLRTTGTILELTFELFFQDAPFVYGEPNTLPDGSKVTPINLRFYVSSFELLTTNGAGSKAVDVVDGAKVPLPYNVHLYAADDDASHTLRVLAPPGSYAGVRFVLGLSDACNWGDQMSRGIPLDDSSQMTWGPLGYLFLRYESHVAAVYGAAIPIAIHMGNLVHDVMPVVVALDGALNVPATGSGSLRKMIRVQMDQIFVGAMKGVDPTLPAAVISEVDNGERLRMAASDLHLFGFP